MVYRAGHVRGDMAKPGVHNSDANLREIIFTIFASDSRFSSSDLRVGVLNGIVHLAGKVNTMADRDAVEQLARQVSGIRGVVNRIDTLGAPSPSRIIDLDFINEKERRIGS